MLNNYNFDKICRICLITNQNMSSIYETDIIKMLTAFTAVHIELDDGLPGQICANCLIKVSDSYSFKQQCENSDELLRKIKYENDEQLKNKCIKSDIIDKNNVDTSRFSPFTEHLVIDLPYENDNNDCAQSDFDEDESKINLDETRFKISLEELSFKTSTDNNTSFKLENTENSESEKLLNTDEDKTPFEPETTKNITSKKELDKELVIDQQEAYFYPIESESEAQKESALERALLLGPDKCDPMTKTCKICNKILYNVHSLVRHVETHNKNRKYEIMCPVCNKGFYEKKHIKNHLLRHNGQARFICENCKKPFYELNALRAHVKKKHPNTCIPCSDCNETFVLSQDLDLHMKNHKEHQYFCAVCSKPFMHRYLLRKHQWMHAKERLFHCKQCEKSFKSKQVLHLHYKRCHSGEKKREICNICGKSVVYLKNHMYIHTDEKYKCTKCEQEFTNKYSLEKHTKRKHGNMDETTLNPYLCNICGKRSENLTMLNRHILTHSEEKKHKCPICNKPFKSIELVNSHVRYTHNNVRNFKCTMCSKCFHTTSGLKLHMRTHTGERPFECEVCSKAFQQRSTLKTHMKVHGYSTERNKLADKDSL